MPNQEQIDYWNGEAGKRWAQEDDTMAQLFQPISEALLNHTPLLGRKNALDVGCGGGSQSLLLAQRLGAQAMVLGVDISEPMLAVARNKALQSGSNSAQLEFIQADAATHAFTPSSFDLVFSRFGVMFFDDPIAAFTNIHSAMQPQGRLVFCCWQGMKRNDWTRIPIQAALQHMPPPEPPIPNAPGPFAFADAGRVENILLAAGFSDVAVQPHSTTLKIGGTDSLSEAVQELARIGPVSRLLMDQPQAVLDKIFPAMEAALESYYSHNCLNLQAAIWLVTATRE